MSVVEAEARPEQETDSDQSLPEGWVEVSLSDLGDWCGGGTPSKRKPSYWEGTVPWVSPKDMKQLILEDTQDHITDTAISESSAKLIPANGIAFVVRSGILEHTLPVALVPFQATVNQDLRVLMPTVEINPQWLLYVLLGSAEDIRQSCQKDGTTVASIDVPRLQDWVIGLPPRAEQDRIVEAVERCMSGIDVGLRDLDRTEAAIDTMKATALAAAVSGALVETSDEGDTAEELLHQALEARRASWENAELSKMQASDKSPSNDNWKRRYKPPLGPDNSSTFSLPHGWVLATVDQVAVLVQYGTSTKTTDDATGIPVLRMGNIVDGELVIDKLKYLPEDSEEFPELHLAPGDILFNRTNSAELVGKSAVYREDPDPCSFASYLIRVRLFDRMRPEFLVYFLNSPLGRQWIKTVVSQQVGQANVNGTKLKNLAFPLPPASVQDLICQTVQNQLAVIAEARQTIAAANTHAGQLRRAVFRRALAGHLVPQDRDDEPAAELLKRIQNERTDGSKQRPRRRTIDRQQLDAKA